MKLIVGLGNPGRNYIGSRHNIGFSVIKVLAGKSGLAFKKEKESFCLSAKGRLSGSDVLLAMPLTYMNLSGISTAALLKKYKIDLGNVLVVCDDLNLDFGRLKIRPRGSAGGHRGLQSIIENLKTQDFARLRIGIGGPDMDTEASEYVLADFNRKEKKELKAAFATACDCCLMWAESGLAKAMNIFNKKKPW